MSEFVRNEPLCLNKANNVTPLTSTDRSHVVQQLDGAVLHIRLNRPERLNALNLATLSQLLEALQAAQADDAVRVIALSGMGRAFCTGADLEEAVALQGCGVEDVLEAHYRPLIEAMRHMPKPVVAAVHGVAAGAGCALAFAADIVLAAQRASFRFPFGGLGLVPDAGSTWVLPRLIGHARATHLLMTAGSFSAEQAWAWGAVAEVVPDDELPQRLQALTLELADMAPKAQAELKALLLASGSSGLDQQLRAEELAQAKLIKTRDAAAGVMAFLTKTKPQFAGT